jgi:hypothetical protein
MAKRCLLCEHHHLWRAFLRAHTAGGGSDPLWQSYAKVGSSSWTACFDRVDRQCSCALLKRVVCFSGSFQESTTRALGFDNVHTRVVYRSVSGSVVIGLSMTSTALC